MLLCFRPDLSSLESQMMENKRRRQESAYWSRLPCYTGYERPPKTLREGSGFVSEKNTFRVLLPGRNSVWFGFLHCCLADFCNCSQSLYGGQDLPHLHATTPSRQIICVNYIPRMDHAGGPTWNREALKILGVWIVVETQFAVSTPEKKDVSSFLHSTFSFVLSPRLGRNVKPRCCGM